MKLEIMLKGTEVGEEIFTVTYDSHTQRIHVIGILYPADLKLIHEIQSAIAEFKDRYSKGKLDKN